MDTAEKAFIGALAALLLVALGWGVSTAGAEGAAFGLFAWLTLGGSLLCVWERSVVRSAFALMGTFVGAAGLFVLLGSDFIAVAQILIYVGGILALLLFGVMLTPPDLTERKLPRVLSGLGLIGAGVAFVAAKVAATVEWSTAEYIPPMRSQAEEIGVAFLAPGRYVVAFELAAVLLTVALVAAVYIARRKGTDFETAESANAKGSGV